MVERRVLGVEKSKLFLSIVFGCAKRKETREDAVAALNAAGFEGFNIPVIGENASAEQKKKHEELLTKAKADISARMTQERNRQLAAIEKVLNGLEAGSVRRAKFSKVAMEKLDNDCPMFTRGRVAGTSSAELVDAFSSLLDDIDAAEVDSTTPPDESGETSESQAAE